MAEKCICNINGHPVKDSTARESITTLELDLEDVKRDTVFLETRVSKLENDTTDTATAQLIQEIQNILWIDDLQGDELDTKNRVAQIERQVNEIDEELTLLKEDLEDGNVGAGGSKIYKHTLKFGMMGSYDFYVLNMPNYEHTYANFLTLCSNAFKIDSTMLSNIIHARVFKETDGAEKVSFCVLTFNSTNNEFALQGNAFGISSFTYEGVTEV